MRRCLLKIKIIHLVAAVTFLLTFSWAGKEASASFFKDGLTTFDFMAMRYITVKGDAAKFRALNWMDDGITGGIREMTFEGDIEKGKHLSFEGHAIPGDNDFGATLKLTRGNGGYIMMDYGNFRRYYDVYGGFVPSFTGAASISRLAADPKMDMGHFFFEVNSNSESDPGLSLSFERDTKDGIKNMLSWGTVTQGVRRSIFPSWQEEGFETNAVTLKGRADVAGFRVNGEQRAEFFDGRLFREDQVTTTSTTLTSFEQEPQATLLVSSLRGDRWIVDDKTYVGFAYQYQHLKNDLLQTIANYNTSGVLSSTSTNRVTDAQSHRDAHTWVQHFVTDLTSNLNLIAKFKEEIVDQSGDSFSEGYSGGTPITISSQDKIVQTGQSVSLRYKGIPKMSLYTDWDFLQSRNWLTKRRTSLSTAYYDNLDRDPETTGVVGVRYVPNGEFNMTSQVKHKADHNTYKTYYVVDPGITLSRLQTDSDEWDNRFTWKPFKWLEHSIRFQWIDNVYRVQSLDQTTAGFTTTTDWIKSQGTSRVYTYNMVMQPCYQWIFDIAYSLNQFKVSTPASQHSVAAGTNAGGIPVFLANVYTWLFSTNYAPKDNLSFSGSLQYTMAPDYDGHGNGAIAYGVDNMHYDINLGMKWEPKKDFTLEPHYGYYYYRANDSIDYGNYSAQVIWLDTTWKW